MTHSSLVFIDTETTGLNPAVHQAYEVAWQFEDSDEVEELVLPHDLANADPRALEIGGYFDRGFGPTGYAPRFTTKLLDRLRGATLVGSNPAFDSAFLTRSLGAQVWSHRMIDVSAGAMWVFGWNRPRGLADVATHLRDQGYTIPAPTHTAAGDVRTTAAVYYALLDARGRA